MSLIFMSINFFPPIAPSFREFQCPYMYLYFKYLYLVTVSISKRICDSKKKVQLICLFCSSHLLIIRLAPIMQIVHDTIVIPPDPHAFHNIYCSLLSYYLYNIHNNATSNLTQSHKCIFLFMPHIIILFLVCVFSK